MPGARQTQAFSVRNKAYSVEMLYQSLRWKPLNPTYTVTDNCDASWSHVHVNRSYAVHIVHRWYCTAVNIIHLNAL
jgi:hypothetical protein